MKNKLNKLSAGIPLYDKSKGKLEGIGPLGLEGTETTTAPSTFAIFLSSAIGLLTVVAAIWFVFQFMIGAIGIISAGGDKAKVESARNRITHGTIGFVLVVIAIFIVDLFGGLIGLDILNSITNLLGV